MKHRPTRTTSLALAGLVAAGVVVPLSATPAQAVAATTERAFVLADTDNDGYAGLYRPTTPLTGTLDNSNKVFENATTDVTDVSSSQDGSRIAYTQDTYTAAGDALREQVVVADASGRTVRVVDDIAGGANSMDIDPVLSPDGNTVAWVRLTFSTTSLSVSVSTMTAPVGTGAATVVANGYGVLAFLSNTQLLVKNASAVYTMPVAGGATSSTIGFPLKATHVSVSPDGTHVAWALDTTTSGAATGTVQAATLTTTGTVTAGTPVTLSSAQNNTSPSFSRDSTTVYFEHDNGTGGTGAIWSGPADGSTQAAATAASAADEYGVAMAATDAVAPGSATAGTATLNGTSATVRWTLPADTDLSGVVIRRALGSTVQKAVYVPAPVAAYTDSGLTQGSTYTYTFQTVDRSGNYGTVDANATHQLTAVGAGATFAANPTSGASPRAPFVVRFASAAPTTVHFTVDYRVNSGSTWTRWVTDQPGLSRTFGSAATTGVAATTATPGASYQFRVSATDGLGNTTPLVGTAAALVPYDQTAAYFSSGTTVNVSTAWLGSYRAMRTAGSYASFTQTGNLFMLVGFTCSTCGVLDLYADGKLVRTVDTYSATGAARTVLTYVSYPTAGQHRLVVKVRGTSGRPNVILDGFAVRH